MIILTHWIVKQTYTTFGRMKNIQNAETENLVLLNEQQLETEALQKRTKKTRTPLRKF